MLSDNDKANRWIDKIADISTKVAVANKRNVVQTAMATIISVNANDYTVRLLSSPDDGSEDFEVVSKTTEVLDVGDPVMLHYVGDLTNAYIFMPMDGGNIEKPYYFPTGGIPESDLATGVQNKLNTPVNPNILDNWYWIGGGSQGGDRTPINQRGNTTYSVSGYTIDRWRVTNAAVTVTVNSSYVQFKNTGTSVQYINQRFPLTQPWPFWKYVTGSILLNDNEGTLLSGTVYPNSSTQTENYQNWTFVTASWGKVFIELPPTGYNFYQFVIRLDAGQTINVRAVKMEIGKEQTLAYLHPSGSWQVREIPNYDEQLMRCMYYYQTYNYYLSSGYLTTSNTQYVMPINLNAPIHPSATVTAGTVTARKASGGYSAVYTSAGVSMQSIALNRHSPANYHITDTRSSASSDTNNSMLLFYIRNLVFKYEP